MKILIRSIAFSILVVFSSPTISANSKTAKIVFTGDLPLIEDKVHGDYRRLASYLKLIRAQETPSFFLFGGGSIGPSPMSSFDKGAHIIDILNSLEPDAMGITKREFSYSEDELSQRAYEAAFPIIASNIYDPITNNNLDGLQPSTIIKKGDVSIGVVSTVNPSVIEEYLLDRIKLIPRTEALRRESEKLREAGVDVVVLLYSVPNDIVEPLMFDQVIDVAFMVDKAFSQTQNYTKLKHKNHFYLHSPGEVLQVELKITPQKPIATSLTTFKLNNFPIDEDLSNQSNSYVNRLERLLNIDVASLNVEIDTRKLSIRTKETFFGNIMTDAIKAFLNTDIVLINSGVVRGDTLYAKNTVWTMRDIVTELPFRSRLIALEVTGQQIENALENGLSQLTDVKGRFPLVAGLSLTYNKQMPVGNRVIDIYIGDNKLDKNKLYTVGTTEYIANGGDGYTTFKQSREIKNSLRVNPLLSEILIMYLQNNRQATPSIEGRIKEVNSYQ